MLNSIQIVGGVRDGEFTEWIGNRVRLQGEWHDLFRVTFDDCSTREYYVKRGVPLSPRLRTAIVTKMVRVG